MKKIISILLTVCIIFSMTACTTTPSASVSPSANVSETTPTPTPPATPTPTPTPTPDMPTYPVETVKLNELGKYTIVYPSVYNEYRINEVKLLKDTIKNVTGADLEIIPDTADKRQHEIILASSTRENGVEEGIELFQSGLDYVIGVQNGNIILGGNNFYADMRAIYDFINNILGYDDIDDKYNPHAEEISDVNFKIYEKPLLTIYACNYAVSPFVEQYAIRDMHDAHFSMTTVWNNWYTDAQLLDFLKWCARYEIFVILFNLKDVELYKDCPVIWGHCIRDEPHIEDYISYDKQCDEYLEKYGEYGWKPWINYFGFSRFWSALVEHSGLFDAVPQVSFDRYFGMEVAKTNDELLTVFENARNLAKRKNQDLWCYIESYIIRDNTGTPETNPNYGKFQNTSKMLRWSQYISLSFGAKGILYFQYSDVAPDYDTHEGDWTNGALITWDYIKNKAWYDAKTANEELLKLAEIYIQYENIGAKVLNRRPADISMYLESPYPYMDKYITEFIEPQDTKHTYLLGFFEKTDGNGKAFTLVNADDLDDVPYDETETKTAKIKVNGENAKFYLNGVDLELEKDSNGYYNVEIGNGYCYFVTID